MLSRLGRKVPRALVLLFAIVVTVAPLLWIVSTSIKTEQDLYAYPPTLVPAEPTFEWYPFLVRRGFVQAILRSCLVSFMATLIVLGLSGFAAYGFSRYRFKGKELMLLAVLGTQMLPGVINIIPLYQMMISFGLLNTLAAVYLILAAMNVPLAVWMLKGFFDSIPISLDESALVDGASRLYTYPNHRASGLPRVGCRGRIHVSVLLERIHHPADHDVQLLEAAGDRGAVPVQDAPRDQLGRHRLRCGADDGAGHRALSHLQSLLRDRLERGGEGLMPKVESFEQHG